MLFFFYYYGDRNDLLVLHFSISGPKSKGLPSGPLFTGAFLPFPNGFLDLVCASTKVHDKRKSEKISFEDLNIASVIATLVTHCQEVRQVITHHKSAL